MSTHRPDDFLARLETDRIRLREFSATDLELLIALDSDPVVMRHLTDGHPRTRDEVAAALDDFLAVTREHSGRLGYWAAIEKGTHQFLGWFHFRPSRNDPQNFRRIELGYRLVRSSWGRGYATEVSRGLIEDGFRELGVDEVFARTIRANLASQSVMRKCGMVLSREFIEEKFPGADKRAVEYSRTR